MARGRRAERLRPAVATMDDSRIRWVAVGRWILERHAADLGNGSSDARPDLDLSCCAQTLNYLAFGSARGGGSDDSVVGRQFAVWSLRPQNALRTKAVAPLARAGIRKRWPSLPTS